MSLAAFFAQRTVFTLAEWRALLAGGYSPKRRAQDGLLAYHLKVDLRPINESKADSTVRPVFAG